MKGVILSSLLVFASVPAFSQIPVVPAGEMQATARQETGGFDAVRQGLAEEMLLSAEELDAGQRKKAMEALDRALKLGEFGKSASALPEEGRKPFQGAHKAIKDARHAVQMGRPEDAVPILAQAAAMLRDASLPNVPEPGMTYEQAAELEGNYVLNARGHRLGELKEYAGASDAPAAVIGVGGLLSLGETIVEIPLNALLASKRFMVLPSTISQQEFAQKGE